MKNLLRFRSDKARSIICQYVRVNYQRIRVEPGQCRFNFRCHNNAIHEAIENDWDRIAMCVYIENGWPIAHFLNVDPEGTFIDNTFGHNIRDKEFYLVRYVLSEEFDDIYYLHDVIQEELESVLPRFTRFFSNVYGE